MTDFYDRKGAVADRLITLRGSDVVLIKSGNGPFNVSTGTMSVSPVEYNGKAVVLDLEQKEIDGTVVKIGDQKCLMSISPDIPKPTTQDKIRWQGATYKVILARDLAPAGQSVLYRMVIRK